MHELLGLDKLVLLLNSEFHLHEFHIKTLPCGIIKPLFMGNQSAVTEQLYFNWYLVCSVSKQWRHVIPAAEARLCEP